MLYPSKVFLFTSNLLEEISLVLFICEESNICSSRPLLQRLCVHKSLLGLHACLQKLKSMVLQKAKELKKFRHLAQVVVRQRGEVELFLLDSIQLVKNQIYLYNQVQHSRTVDTAGSVTNSSLKSERESAPTSLPAINSRSPSSWPGAGPWPRYRKPLPYNAMYSGGDRSDSANARRKAEFLEYLSEEEAATQISILDELGETHMPDQVLPKIDISELSLPDREKVLRYLFKKINTAHQADAVRLPQNFQGSKSDAGRTIV